jgi:tyrosine-protein kinase Etk/Wzc
MGVFATVPHSDMQGQLYEKIIAKVPGQHLLAVVKSDDAGVESLRSLRTALQFALLDARNNIVLFSGPTPGIGKSFVSANFAAVLAAAGKRVLLVDADLRKGYINQYFGFARGPGLSEVIAGSQKFEQVVHRDAAPTLDVLTTGQLPPNPGELLMSPAMAQFMLTVSEQYDLVLIDTPPVLAVSDTQVVAAGAGTVFLVAKANVTTVGELQESVKRLSQAGVSVKGVVFNDYITSKRRYGGYGYSYGYRYGRYQYKNYEYGK